MAMYSGTKRCAKTRSIVDFVRRSVGAESNVVRVRVCVAGCLADGHVSPNVYQDQYMRFPHTVFRLYEDDVSSTRNRDFIVLYCEETSGKVDWNAKP